MPEMTLDSWNQQSHVIEADVCLPYYFPKYGPQRASASRGKLSDMHVLRFQMRPTEAESQGGEPHISI